MKKLHLGFGVAAAAVLMVGLLHGGAAWIFAEVTWDPLQTSFPTWAAFVLPVLSYGIGVCVILLAWFAAWLIARGVSNKKLQKDRQSDIL